MTAIVSISLFCFGASIASLIGVLTDRWFEPTCWKDIIIGRSQCLLCRKTLSLYQILPLVSWIKLRGKCFYCQAAISPIYPLTEVGLGSCFLVLNRFDFPLCFYGLASLSLWLAWMDWKYLHLPILGLFLFAALGINSESSFWLACLLSGVAFPCGYLELCAKGDVFLLIACSPWLSWAQLPLFLILAGLGLGIYGQWHRQIPLAPPLLLALWVTLVVSPRAG